MSYVDHRFVLAVVLGEVSLEVVLEESYTYRLEGRVPILLCHPKRHCAMRLLQLYHFILLRRLAHFGINIEGRTAPIRDGGVSEVSDTRELRSSA